MRKKNTSIPSDLNLSTTPVTATDLPPPVPEINTQTPAATSTGPHAIRNKMRKLKRKAKHLIQQLEHTSQAPPWVIPPDAYTLTPEAYKFLCEQTQLQFNSDLSGYAPYSSIPASITADRPASLQETMTCDLLDKTCLIYSSRDRLRILLQHYTAAKALHPTRSRAAVLIPACDLKKVQDLMKGWQLVTTLKRKTMYIRKHWQNRKTKTQLNGMEIYVFKDTEDPIDSTAPAPSLPTVYKMKDKPLTMSFDAKVDGAKAFLGVDSFAEGTGYVHPRFVEQNRLSTRPAQATIVLGDGHENQCTEECLLHINMGGHISNLWLLVIPIPEPYDILLGDEWLVQNNVRMLYDKKCLEIVTAKRRFLLKSTLAAPPVSYTPKHIESTGPENTVLQQPVSSQNQEMPTASTALPTADPGSDSDGEGPELEADAPTAATKTKQVLSYIKYKRALRKGGTSILCFVQKMDNPLLPEIGQHPDLTASHRQRLNKLLQQYQDIFGSKLYTDAIPKEDMPTVIDIMPGSKIPNRPLYRYSPLEVQEIEKQVQEMLAQGLVQHSTSPYGAPVLLVKKPDGTWRFCVDYRALNAITVRNAHALPRIDDLLDRIQGAKYFSSMDLLQGFYQMPLPEHDRPKTAFKTTFGHFEFRVVAMGLCNAPSVFQRMMNSIFRDQLNKSVLIYLDDILVFSKTLEEHIQHLQQVFDTIRKNQLSLKVNKCHFFQEELKFLGHIISKEGIKPDAEKVKVVLDWPTPVKQTDVRAFLGLTQYFRRFIRNYAAIAGPLTDLTKLEYKKRLIWNPRAEAAFQELKKILCTAPLLKVPDFSRPFTVVSDASLVGLGGVLLQDNQPCAFESKKFTPTERAYTTTERELFATVYCYQKWAVYLRHNTDNVFETDHLPNTYFNTKPTLTPKEIRWMELLATFPGTWQYKPGKGNIADPLSRMPTFYTLAMISHNKTGLDLESAQIQPAQQMNLMQEIRKAYSTNPPVQQPEWQHHNGLFYVDGKMVIPDHTEIRQYILQECHDSVWAGHAGRDKTLEAVKRLFYWRGLAKDVTDYVHSCHTCQVSKSAATQSQGMLHTVEVSTRPWYTISCDFVTALPESVDGYNAICTVVDRCTKMVHLIKCTDSTTAAQFAQLMLDNVFTKHGLPGDILTDRDPRFTGHFWRQMCECLNIHCSFTSAWHPQSDGQTERMNRTIEQVLRAHAADRRGHWSETLSLVEFSMNNSMHASLQQTPFFLNFHQHPLTPIMIETLVEDKISCAEALRTQKNYREVLDFAMQQLKAARDRMKSYADAKRSEASFTLNQLVLLSTVNINKHNHNRKLFPRFIGPYKITRLVNDVAYELELPTHFKIHNVFHVSLLKEYDGRRAPKTPPVPEVLQDGAEPEYEVDKILQHREKKKGRTMGKEYFVLWSGYGPEHCTWEPEAHLKNAPDAVAEYWQHLTLKAKRKEKQTAIRESLSASAP